MLRSIQASLKRTTYAAPSSTHPLLHRRGYSSEPAPERKLAVLGAGGGIGQPLVAADVRHINTRSEALVNMITNPVNSTVPIAAEVFNKAGTYDEKKLFGLTTLDVVRAKTFYAGVNVPVFGGQAGITIRSLFSQATPKANLSGEGIKALTNRTQYGGTELRFFSSEVNHGKNGVEETQGLESLNEPIRNTLRPLSPHLPIYKPQLSSTSSIFNRISGAYLSAIILVYYLLCLKMGLVCFTFEYFYQFLFYSSNLVLISVELSALALAYHVYHSAPHLLADISGFLFRGRKRLR